MRKQNECVYFHNHYFNYYMPFDVTNFRVWLNDDFINGIIDAGFTLSIGRVKSFRNYAGAYLSEEFTLYSDSTLTYYKAPVTVDIDKTTLNTNLVYNDIEFININDILAHLNVNENDIFILQTLDFHNKHITILIKEKFEYC